MYDPYMQRCVDLAQMGIGKVAPNPMVGSVLIYENEIIGEGWHRRFGGDHAEVDAIKSVKSEDRKKISQATLFVTLEPCNHIGKTPPCVDLILNEYIPKVVIGCLDPNPLMSGKSVEALTSAGVQVEVGPMEDSCKDLIKAYVVNQQLKRPFIALKWAESSDGYMGKEGKKVWLTDNISRIMTHKWRSYFDALLIGWKTMDTDQPQLTNRLYFGPSPIRMVIDYDLRYSQYESLAHDPIYTYVFNTIKDAAAGKLHYVQFKKDRSFFDQLTDFARSIDVYSIMIEGGSATLSTFVDKGYWDEAWILKSPRPLSSGIPSPDFEGHLAYDSQVSSDSFNLYRRLS